MPTSWWSILRGTFKESEGVIEAFSVGKIREFANDSCLFRQDSDLVCGIVWSQTGANRFDTWYRWRSRSLLSEWLPGVDQKWQDCHLRGTHLECAPTYYGLCPKSQAWNSFAPFEPIQFWGPFTEHLAVFQPPFHQPSRRVCPCRDFWARILTSARHSPVRDHYHQSICYWWNCVQSTA